MSADKNDKADLKPAVQFVHPELILGVGRAMAAGALKYSDWNFIKGHGRLQLCAAMIRHTCLIMKGEDIDQDTTERLGQTVYHWDCVVACVNMLIYQREIGTLIDDRPALPTTTVNETGSELSEQKYTRRYEPEDLVTITCNRPYGADLKAGDVVSIIRYVPTIPTDDSYYDVKAYNGTWSVGPEHIE